MNPKVKLFALVVILSLFIWKSYTMLQEIDDICSYNIQQYTTSVQDIGMVFDWYAVVSKDIIVKTAHGVTTCDELKKTLVEGREHKNKLLKDYYNTFTPVEISLVDKFKESDKNYDTFIDSVLITAENKNCEEIEKFMPQLFSLTGQLQDEVNNILNIKNEYVVDSNKRLFTCITRYEEFCIILCVLLAVISSSFFFKKS